MEWKLEDCWTFAGEDFLVEIRHTETTPSDCACYDSDRGNRWCVYAYIYPDHPHFAKFDETDDMWQSAACAMPFHCGPTFLQRHIRVKDGKPEVTSFQIGADYNHDGDYRYTQQRTKEEAFGVFSDARELVEWLQRSEHLMPESEDGPR